MSTILITGCSSGFGLETAKLFLERGWDVIATMRRPDPELLPASERLRILQLDVTDPAIIEAAVNEAGHIDVLVNNAGFGAPSPVELTAPETVQSLFQTNTIGTLAMVQAVLPQMRQRRAGVIINVTSTVTVKALPVMGEQGSSERFHRNPGNRDGDVRRARAYRPAGPLAGDQLRQECAAASAWS
jgi:NADP-dependent 3-hydroxy acid dehydrogenase YdfG